MCQVVRITSLQSCLTLQHGVSTSQIRNPGLEVLDHLPLATELLGDKGWVRTQVCVSAEPMLLSAQFSTPHEPPCQVAPITRWAGAEAPGWTPPALAGPTGSRRDPAAPVRMEELCPWEAKQRELCGE